MRTPTAVRKRSALLSTPPASPAKRNVTPAPWSSTPMSMWCKQRGGVFLLCFRGLWVCSQNPAPTTRALRSTIHRIPVPEVASQQPKSKMRLIFDACNTKRIPISPLLRWIEPTELLVILTHLVRKNNDNMVLQGRWQCRDGLVFRAWAQTHIFYAIVHLVGPTKNI